MRACQNVATFAHLIGRVSLFEVFVGRVSLFEVHVVWIALVNNMLASGQSRCSQRPQQDLHDTQVC